jgi:hypothetical protein
MKRRLTAGMFAAALALTAFAGTAVAAAPASPGCFGRDRAADIRTNWLVDPTGPGASELGAILSARAGDNGARNRAYKVRCGGSPTTSQGTGSSTAQASRPSALAGNSTLSGDGRDVLAQIRVRLVPRD